MKKRLESVDIAKGILIIFICCLHIGNRAMPWVQLPLSGVGIFFFISGYFYKPKLAYMDNVKRRTKQILIPFLVYGIVGLIVVFAFERMRGSEISFEHLADAIVRHVFDNYCLHPLGESTTSHTIALYVLPMWFLIRLYISELIMFIFADWAIVSLRRMLLAVVSLLTATFLWGTYVGINLPFQLNTCFAIAAMLLAGAYARQHKLFDFIENGKCSLKYWGIALAVAAAFAGLLMTSASEYRIVKGFFGNTQSREQMWTVYLWFPLNICGTYLMVMLSSILAKQPVVNKALTAIGRNTLTILSTHQVMAYIIMTLLNIPLFMGKDATEANLGIRILVIIVCIVLGIAINKIKDRVKRAAVHN